MKKLAVILPTLFALCFAALCGCGGRELSLYGGAGGPRGELGSGINLGGGLSSNDAVDGADGVGFAGTPVILAGAVL